MLNDSLAPAKRALIFFGCMAAVVGGLTFGAGFQTPTDQSSTTIAAMRDRSQADEQRVATAEGRAVPASSKQAMAEGERNAVLR